MKHDRASQYIGTAEPEEMAGLVHGAREQWSNYVSATGGLGALWARSYAGYYAAARTLGALGVTGNSSEFVDGTSSMNEYGNLQRLLIAILTAEPPVVKCVAQNSDARSMAQAQLGNIGIAAVWEDVYFKRRLREAVANMSVAGTGWILQRWNPFIGDIVSLDKKTNKPVFSGGIEMRSIHPTRVVYNPLAQTWDPKNAWAIVTMNENRANLQAAYPEFAEELEQLGAERYDLAAKEMGAFRRIPAGDTEAVTVHLFLHPRTIALPEGRSTLVAGDNVLEDGPLQSRYTGLVRFVPEYIEETPHGYTHMFDTLIGQQCVDGVMTSLLTNASSQSKPVLLAPSGMMQPLISLGHIDVMEYSGSEKPSMLAGNPVQGELFQMLAELREMLERQSGVNGIDRGEPQASLKSGSALAFIQGQSKQFLGGAIEAIRAGVEECANVTLALLQSYADTERVASLVGIANQPLLQQWTGTDDLGEVPKVIAEQVGGILGQMAGREQAASTLLANNMIKDPQKYIEFLQTGQIHSLTEQAMRSQLFVRMENEALMRGEAVRALLTDDHYAHLSAHQTITEDPELREKATVDPEGSEAGILEATLTHMQDHIGLLSDPVNGNLLAALGIQPVMQTVGPEGGGNSTGAGMPVESMGGVEEPLPPEQPMPATDAGAMAGGQALDEMAQAV